VIDLTLFRPLAGDPQVSALRGLKTHKAHLAKHGREISLADLHKSAYAKSRHSLYTRNWPLVSLIKVGLKTEWTCGSLLHPLDGDPHHRHRLFVTTCIVISSAAINLLFHRTGGSKEMCEGLEGGSCTDETWNAGLCKCLTFDCRSYGCNNCVPCTSMAQCETSCRLIAEPGVWTSLVTAAILLPMHAILT
jgi:hypothetical protein